MDHIFVESNETQGLLYNHYSKLPGIIHEFVDDIEECINSAWGKDRLPNNNILPKLEKFKHDVEMGVKTPEHIDISEMKSMRLKVTKVKKEAEKVLDRLGSLRKKYRFGSNWIKGILIKPKVYSNSSDDEKLKSINSYMRSVGRSMDWVEKTTVELMNLADQDLNILSLVQKVYFRNLLEEVDFSFNDLDDDIDIMSESIDDLDIDEFTEKKDDKEDSEYFSTTGNEEKEDEDDDILDSNIPKDENDFVPIFTIVSGFDVSKLKNKKDELTPQQKLIIKHAKSIRMITRGDFYTHTLLSFDPTIEKMYHFIGNGFTPTTMHDLDDFKASDSIYVAVTYVTKDEMKIIKKQVKKFMNYSKNTSYDILQLVGQLFGRTRHHDKRLICSAFIGYVLQMGDVKNAHRDFSLIRPEDITILPRSFYVMTFKDMYDYDERKDELSRRLKKIYEDNIDEIVEYNNMLPKTLLRSKLKSSGTIDKLFDFVTKMIDR